MAPPHKRLKITNSSAGTPLRSNHLRRRRSAPVTRSSTQRKQSAQPEEKPQSRVSIAIASTLSEQPRLEAPVLANNENNTAPTGAEQGRACQRNGTESPIETESNDLNNTPTPTGVHYSQACDLSDTSPRNVNGSEEHVATGQLQDDLPLRISEECRSVSIPAGEPANVLTTGTRDAHGQGLHALQHGTERSIDRGITATGVNAVPIGTDDSVGVAAPTEHAAAGDVGYDDVRSYRSTSDRENSGDNTDNGDHSTDRDETPLHEDPQVDGIPHSRVLHRIRSMVTWNRLLACVTLSGRTRMTAEQYEFFRMALQAANSNACLPTYKTARTSHWKEFVHTAFPKSSVMSLRRTQRHRPTGPTIAATDEENHDPADCVKVVLPSEWAKLDVLCLPFYEDVFERTARNVFDIEWAPIVRNRAMVTGTEVTFWCTYDDAVCACQRGDRLRFACDKDVTGDMDTTGIYESLSQSERHTTVTKKHVHVDGVLASVWFVSSASCYSECSTSPGVESLSASEHCVVGVLRDMTPKQIIAQGRSSSRIANSISKRRSKHQKTIYRKATPSELCLYPGDYCAIVRPDKGTNKGVTCLLIASPTGSITGETMERLVWVSDKEHGTSTKHVAIEAEAIVRDLPMWLGGSRHLPTFPTRFSPNKGILQDGTNFVVYRLALYTDGFKQHKSLADSRSVDGCYMLPLGNSLEGRKSSTSSRVISLTPHGHSANEVLHLIEDDLVKGSTVGIDSFDPFGRPVRIFLDVVSMFGDYPALSATADLRGHNATAFCTFCTYRESHTSKSGSRLHSTDVHSRRPSAARTDMRRTLIRPNLHENGLSLLGFKKQTMEETDNLPMVRLAKALKNARPVPKDDEGRNFMPTGFDSVQSMAAAPDHLICGLIESTLEVCFSSLPSNEVRRRIELRMITDARDNGLREQGKFLKWEGNTFKGIRSITMSTKICMLLTSVRPFNEVHGSTRRAEFLLPQQLQMFVSYVYYVPNADVEGKPAADLQTPQGYLNLRGNQMRLAREFLHTSTEVYKVNPELGGILNKPNAHRAIELCVQTITNFGHARNCSEMVLEMAHRKFKAWLECNTHSDSHISGMERAISSDWQGRVAIMYDISRSGSVMERESASRCLRRLLLGEDVLHMDEQSSEGRTVIETFIDAISAAMADPVRREMELSNQVNCVQGRTFAWEVERSRRRVVVDDTMECGRQILEKFLLEAHPPASISLTWATKASYVSASPSTRRRRTYPHLTVKAGNAVSIVTTQTHHSRVVVFEEMDTDRGEMKFFAIYGILRASDGHVWCVTRQLTQHGDAFTVRGSSVCVLKLGRRVSRVAIIHACDKTCIVDMERQQVRHGMSMCDGGLVEVVPRFDGYPPHLG